MPSFVHGTVLSGVTQWALSLLNESIHRRPTERAYALASLYICSGLYGYTHGSELAAVGAAGAWVVVAAGFAVVGAGLVAVAAVGLLVVAILVVVTAGLSQLGCV